MHPTIIVLKFTSVACFIVAAIQFYSAMRARRLSQLMSSKNASLLDYEAWQFFRKNYFMWPTAKTLRAIKRHRV